MQQLNIIRPDVSKNVKKSSNKLMSFQLKETIVTN